MQQVTFALVGDVLPLVSKDQNDCKESRQTKVYVDSSDDADIIETIAEKTMEDGKYRAVA